MKPFWRPAPWGIVYLGIVLFSFYINSFRSWYFSLFLRKFSSHSLEGAWLAPELLFCRSLANVRSIFNLTSYFIVFPYKYFADILLSSLFLVYTSNYFLRCASLRLGTTFSSLIWRTGSESRTVSHVVKRTSAAILIKSKFIYEFWTSWSFLLV